MNTNQTLRLGAGLWVTSACASLLFVCGWVCGCSEPGAKWSREVARPGEDGVFAAKSDQSTNKLVAEVDGTAVHVEDLWPGIAEGGGAAALEEWVLDRGLARLAGARNVEFNAEGAERERKLLISAIAGEIGGDESLSDQALARVRAARGLGPRRFAALLKRTALMRALVRSEVAVSEEEIAAEVELAVGSKVTAVVAMFGTEKEAAVVRAGLEADASERIARLSALARARSIDPSARDGGVVGPVHPRDPRVPGSLRTVMEGLAIGELSPVIATDGGYVVMMIESRTERMAPTAAVDEGARQAVVARQERVAMDRLARGVLAGASVNVIDESLRWSWQRTRQVSGE
jgi:parvulin-like peptidyl-prolyl isomerase